MQWPYPRNYVAAQSGIRHNDEEWHAAITLVWCPSQDSYTIGVTLHEGADGGDLRSEVVGPPVGPIDLPGALRCAVTDLLDFERRTRNPFDDLL